MKGYKCDRCGNFFEDYEIQGYAVICEGKTRTKEGKSTMHIAIEGIDLCADCTEKFYEWKGDKESPSPPLTWREEMQKFDKHNNKYEIEEITLLTIEEAEELPRWILATGRWWWLRSPGFNLDYAAYVYTDGSVYSSGFYVSSGGVCVRPALRIRNLDSLNLEVGTTFKVLDRPVYYIGNNKVLLCEDIGEHRFDIKSNDYKHSEIKDWLEKWLDNEKNKR